MRANQIRKKFVVHTRIGEGEVEGEHVNVRAGPGSCRVGVSRQDKVRVEERERTTRAHTSALVLSMPIFPSLPLSLSILLPLLSFPLSRARAFDAPSLLFFLGAEFSLLFSAYCLARAAYRECFCWARTGNMANGKLDCGCSGCDNEFHCVVAIYMCWLDEFRILVGNACRNLCRIFTKVTKPFH